MKVGRRTQGVTCVYCTRLCVRLTQDFGIRAAPSQDFGADDFLLASIFASFHFLVSKYTSAQHSVIQQTLVPRQKPFGNLPHLNLVPNLTQREWFTKPSRTARQ